MKIDGIILRELHLPLVRPFETSFGVTRDRRILLAEVRSEGLTGWGECTAGEHPYFSGESTDTAWQILLHELGPMLAAESPEHGGDCPRIFRRVRGNRMAKATLENAIWDLEAQREGLPLFQILGGVRDRIACGVSLGIQSSIPELFGIIEKELAAGYQRIKLKCKPGWDVEVLDKVRSRWPAVTLSCDANSAYRLRDADHLVTFDAFDLLMIEQPLWHDDFYYHSMLQKRLNTPICLDESIRNRRDALAAGYQRIKLKCKPGWDVEVLDKVRSRWPAMTLSCDANSAYRLRDADHLVTFDAFDLLMIEQPLWHDDFYYHSMLQKRLNTPICLDESIRNRRDALAAAEMESCKIINIKLGRVGGFSEAIAVHNAAQERGIPVWCGGMLESGIGRAHNIALSTLENFTLPGDVSASARYWKEDIIETEVTVTPQGEIEIPDTPGRGYEVRYDLIERLTVRKEAIRAFELVG